MSETPELSGSALWKQITHIPRPSRTVDFPRTDPATGEAASQVLIQILNQEELQACAAAAEKFARTKLKELHSLRKGDKAEGYDTLFNNEVSVQILCKAVRDPENGRPLFPSPRAASKVLTQEEFGSLMRSYLIAQAELGPVVASMTADEMEAWIVRLKEGAAAHPLALLSSDALTELIMHMVSQLFPSLTARSSHGSPQDDSLTDSDKKQENTENVDE